MQIILLSPDILRRVDLTLLLILQAISLPICLNTSNSQEGPSRGTLIWEAAFPLMVRKCTPLLHLWQTIEQELDRKKTNLELCHQC